MSNGEMYAAMINGEINSAVEDMGHEYIDGADAFVIVSTLMAALRLRDDLRDDEGVRRLMNAIGMNGEPLIMAALASINFDGLIEDYEALVAWYTIVADNDELTMLDNKATELFDAIDCVDLVVHAARRFGLRHALSKVEPKLVSLIAGVMAYPEGMKVCANTAREIFKASAPCPTLNKMEVIIEWDEYELKISKGSNFTADQWLDACAPSRWDLN